MARILARKYGLGVGISSGANLIASVLTGKDNVVTVFADDFKKYLSTDLTKDIEVTPPEAVLGCKKDIQTLHGRIGIKIPPRTSTGQMLRLKDLGLPKKGGGHGNLNARIKIVVPKDLTDKHIELYQKLQEL